MSNFNHLAVSGQDGLSPSELPNQPDLQPLFDVLQRIVDKLQTGELATFKPVRRAVRPKTACGMTGDGMSHFWARQNPKDPAWDPTFPTAFKLGDSPRSGTVWFADEIETWLESRAAATRKLAQAASERARWKRAPATNRIGAGVTA